jgi:hypothetical protein
MTCRTDEQKETIYKCAEGLLRITHTMKDIDDGISFKALQLSDEVLKLIEECGCKEDISQFEFKPAEDPNDFQCIGHSNIPGKVEESNLDNEVDMLVNKIKMELKK